MLLPDSLSQLEEFGRHKRPRKAHRGHGRPRLFSDLWVRIGDRCVIYHDSYFSSLEDIQLHKVIQFICHFIGLTLIPYLVRKTCTAVSLHVRRSEG